MKMSTYIIRRLLLLIPVVLGVTVFTFLLTRADIGLWISSLVGRIRTPATRAKIIAEYHLKAPVFVQYFYYMQGLVTGHWGFTSGFDVLVGTYRPVLQVMEERLPNTIELAIASIILIIIFSIPLGVISAVRRDKLPDHASRLWAMISYSTPTFWLGLLIIFAIAPYVPITDISGALNSSYYFTATGRFEPWVVHQGALILGTRPTGFLIVDTLLYGDFPAFLNALGHIALPALTVALTSMGAIVRFLRSSMLDAMGQDYVRTAKAKGLPQKRVINKHVKRNAYSATITILGLLLASLMGGVVITEDIFSWPGIGYWLAEAAIVDDFASIMASVFVFAIIIVVANLVVDIIYAYLDPRVRLG
ncbi:MAG: ABC transporter permease [Candidatus Thermoplasmatota archaeon]|jgi:peptide/nickel transport system permease protein|nr:ABC transporter permease [Candidatus Thermoplasmatota archaeon]